MQRIPCFCLHVTERRALANPHVKSASFEASMRW